MKKSELEAELIRVNAELVNSQDAFVRVFNDWTAASSELRRSRMRPLQSVSQEIVRLDGRLSEVGSSPSLLEYKEVLLVCRALLLRSELVRSGFAKPDDAPLSGGVVEDFVFGLITRQGVNLRELVSAFVNGRQNAVADAIGIRRGTLSEYLNGKTAMSSDTVEKILNFKTPENGN